MTLLKDLLRRFSALKISTKVTTASVFIVLFQGVISIIGMSVVINQANRESFRSQLERTSHSVESFIESAVADLAVKSALLAGQQKIIDFTDYGLNNLLQQELSVLRLPLKVDAMCIVDVQQDILASVGEPKLIDAFRYNSLARNYWDGNPKFIFPYSVQIHLWALSPIVKSKSVVGVLALGLNMDPTFINRIEFITNSAVLLSWRKQIFVSGTLPATFFNEFVESVRDAGVQDQQAGLSGGGRYFTSTFKLSGLPGLYAHCFLDTGDSRMALARYRNFSLGFLLLIILLSISTSFMLYRYAFLKPFRIFTDAIHSISAGNLGHSLERVGKDEFGDLARAFEEMMRSLRQREKELAELGQYNSLVLANVHSGILTIAFEGVVTAINPAACSLLGLVPSDIGTGRTLAEMDLPRELKLLVDESLHTVSSVTFREIKAQVNGSVRVFSVSTSPFMSQKNAKLGIIVIISDVTREKELEEKLEISSRMVAMGEMVAGVAHQIRNPLGVMKVSADLLKDHMEKLSAGEQPRKLVSMIVKETDSLGNVVSNFLDFARPLTVRKEYCEVEELIRHVASTLPMDDFPGVELRCQFAPNLPPAHLDRDLFSQAFSNLLMNALQASKPGQAVLVDAWRADSRLVVEVRDFGHGMDEAVKKKIFNPFFTTKSNGTGLGLSIVHRIVESHGGKIELLSEPDKGTTFRVHI